MGTPTPPRTLFASLEEQEQTFLEQEIGTVLKERLVQTSVGGCRESAAFPFLVTETMSDTGTVCSVVRLLSDLSLKPQYHLSWARWLLGQVTQFLQECSPLRVKWRKESYLAPGVL